MRLLASQLRSPGPIVFATAGRGPAPEQRAAQIPVLWPRVVGGKTRMVPIHPSRIPAGWQSVQVHVPGRPATCAEVRCPQFLRGWTEILPAGGGIVTQAGIVKLEEAVAVWGETAGKGPTVIEHPPGTTCGRVHKIASGIPPLYTVNGRPTLWNEFEDALGGGVHRMQTIGREGRY